MPGGLTRGLISALLVCGALPAVAQDLDANITSRSRKPAAIADQISDPAQREAFYRLYERADPASLLLRASTFVQKYPDSAFLAQAYEIAARSSFDLHRYNAGLQYARESLTLLPENPLLLVAVADVQAREKNNDAAIQSASDALLYLTEFANPISVEPEKWPSVRRHEQAIAYFSMGRAQLQKALQMTPAEDRRKLLASSLASLRQARFLNPEDQEMRYLEGMAYLSTGDLRAAEADFAAVCRQGGDLRGRALDTLQAIYRARPPDPRISFEQFLRDAQHFPQPGVAVSPPPPSNRLSGYAGSESCRDCHADIYRRWSQTGMARMLRPYRFENIKGDFEKDNQYYTGDDVQYVHGKLTILPGKDRRLFARMEIHAGRHFFRIRQSDGAWHTYPVDYTIGSKWQQAYATRLPNGEIHVFPVQYSLLTKRWINYWLSLDGPGTERSDPHNFERLDDATSYQDRCAICHTSQLRNTRGGGLAADGLEFQEAGVDCEMCHGPSADHVAAMESGADFNQRALDPPVDFRKIGNQDFVAICAQCHMQSALRTPGPHGELNYSPEGTFFQRDVSVPYGEFTRKGFYKDGRFSQTTFIVEALRRSKCYRIGKISCGNCHDPHGHNFADNQTSLIYKDNPDRMCTGCHKQLQDKAAVAAHTHHAWSSEGSRCVSCHMPRIMDALTFSARTHRIDDIPNPEMTLRFGQRESPNACLLCHQTRTAEWVLSEMRAWKRSPQPNNSAAWKAP